MTEQQYNNSVAIYNPNGGHRAGKIYDIKGTNDLTVTGGGGTRFKEDGSLETLVFRNIVNSPINFTTASWTNSNAVISQNQIGITGQLNEASLIEDNSSSVGSIGQITPISTNTPLRTSFWVKKDSENTVYREIYVQLNGGAAVDVKGTLVDFKTSTGEWVYRAAASGYGFGDVHVLDKGDWWEVVVLYSATLIASNNSMNISFRPAINTNGSSFSGATTGSAILGYIGATNSTNIEEDPIPHSGGAVKINYNSGKPAFLIEPTRTNLIPYSYNLNSPDNILRAGTVATVNQVGITGEPNTATLIEDTMTGDYAEVNMYQKSLSGIGKASVWIKKDTNQTRFPEILMSFNDTSNATVNSLVSLNTQTGEIAYRDGNSTNNSVTVLDRGDWWEIVAISLVALSKAKVIIRPALGNTIATYSNTATGSIIVGHVGVSQSSIVDETPIITNGAAVTRTYNYCTGYISPTTDTGHLYYNFKPHELPVTNYHVGVQISENGDIYERYGILITVISGSPYIQVYLNGSTLSQTYNIPVVNETEYKVLLTWSGGTIYVYCNGALVGSRTFPTPQMNRLNLANFDSPLSNRTPHMSVYGLRISREFIADADAKALTTV